MLDTIAIAAADEIVSLDLSMVKISANVSELSDSDGVGRDALDGSDVSCTGRVKQPPGSLKRTLIVDQSEIPSCARGMRSLSVSIPRRVPGEVSRWCDTGMPNTALISLLRLWSEAAMHILMTVLVWKTMLMLMTGWVVSVGGVILGSVLRRRWSRLVDRSCCRIDVIPSRQRHLLLLRALCFCRGRLMERSGRWWLDEGG